MELLLAGFPVSGILEKTGEPRFPPSIIKYLFCCPSLDFSFRCLPSDGGFYNQRMRDFIEFSIIESRIEDFRRRKRV